MIKRGSVISEVIFLTALALVLGTTVHLARPDNGKKIEWIKFYPNVFKVKDKGSEKAVVSHLQSDRKVLSEKKKIVEEEKKPEERPKKPIETEGIREITVDEAILEHQNGTPFLDARRSRQFKEGHIPGAHSASVWESGIDERISDLFDKIPFDTPVVVYCSSGDCEDSHDLATRLKTAGYKDISVMRGGFPEWLKKNKPVEKDAGESGAPEGDPKEEGE